MSNSEANMGNDTAALVEAIEGNIPIEYRYAHISLTESTDDNVIIPIRVRTDGDGSELVEVFEDALRELDSRQRAPLRRIGTSKLHELESLIAYVKRYGSVNSIAWANSSDFSIAVVFNDHPDGADSTNAGWRDHRAVYTCPRSPEWQAWCEFDGKAIEQAKFGDFIESRLEDLRSHEGYPKPLDVLTMARSLTIRTKGTFERQINPTTGDGILVNKLENEVGSTVIPRAFLLGIPVFEGGNPYQVEARVRFAIADGRPAFSYSLHRRKEIERDAFGDVRKSVTKETGIILLAGLP